MSDTSAGTDGVIVGTYIALAVALVASFMPWARVLFLTINGTDGDGSLTLVLAFVAGAFLAGWHVGQKHRRGFLVVSLFATLAAAGIFWYDMINITRLANDANSASGNLFHISVTPQAGLYLGVIGATSAVVLLVVLLRRDSPAATELVESQVWTQPVTSVPPGWHKDPTERHIWRFWNGSGWTNQVKDGDVESDDALT